MRAAMQVAKCGANLSSPLGYIGSVRLCLLGLCLSLCNCDEAAVPAVSKGVVALQGVTAGREAARMHGSVVIE